MDLEEAVRELARQPQKIKTCRFRLHSISWFQKALKEPIARRANREDGCAGAFWESRFHCAEVVDEPGRLSVAIYHDLQEVRAEMAASPEESTYTSAFDRIATRRKHRKQLRRRPSKRTMAHDEDGLWLKPVMTHEHGNRGGFLSVTLDTYLAILDNVGRMMRAGKRGVIAAELAPILERLEIEIDTWLESLLRKTKRIGGTAIGLARNLQAVAERRGQRQVRSHLRLDG